MSCFPFAWLHDLHKIKCRQLWTWKTDHSQTLEIDPQASRILLQENALQWMETLVINVKQTLIYNIVCELYVILQLISCCCWKNFIDLNLRNEPNKQRIIFFLTHSKNWFMLVFFFFYFTLENWRAIILLDHILFVPQFQSPLLFSNKMICFLLQFSSNYSLKSLISYQNNAKFKNYIGLLWKA